MLFQCRYSDISLDGNGFSSAVEAAERLSGVVGNFKSAGGTAKPTPWQPQPDWFDIEKIFKEDPDPNKRCILLLADSFNTFVFDQSVLGNSLAYYRTSDGAIYNANATHTFNKNQDKKCSKGYYTRYIIVYSPDKNIKISPTNSTQNTSSLYLYIGNDSHIQQMQFSTNTQQFGHFLLEAIVSDDTVTSASNPLTTTYGLRLCQNLRRFDFFKGMTHIADNSFSYTNFEEFKIPSGITYIGAVSLCANYMMKKVYIPASVIFIGTNCFNPAPALIEIIIEDGWVAPTFSLAEALRMPARAFVDFFNKLGRTIITQTITLGATNLAKLTPAEIAIATNKGYTIN
jgi:hypothetical protein